MVRYFGRLRTRWRVVEDLEGVEMSIYGRQGCRMVLSLDGKMLDFLPMETMLPNWTLGGNKERYWSGEIENWRFYGAKH